MTYLNKVYKPSPANWTLDVGVDTANAGNVIIIPDYIFSGATEIKNNVGVAAVGTTDSGATTDWDCYYPIRTITFPLTGATPSGTIIVQDGWKIDFAQDLTQPSVVATYGVNKDVFNFNDNDDKRKLSTKVIVKGKDFWGKSISVSLSGVHAYDNDRQFYNDATYITQKTEGYILKNSYVKQIPGFWTIGSGDIAAKTISGWSRSAVPYNSEILFGSNPSLVPVGTEVTFGTTSASLPPELTAGTKYYCVEQGNTLYCKVSGSLGGTPIYLTGTSYSPDWRMYIPIIPGPPTYFTTAELPITEGDYIRFSADTFPTGISSGVDYITNTVVKSGYGGTFKVNVTPTTAGATVSFFVKGDVKNSFDGFESIPFIYLYGWNYKIFYGHAITIRYGDGVYSDVVFYSGEYLTEDNIKVTWVWLSGGKQFDSTQVFANGAYMLNSTQYIDDINPVAYTNDVLIGEERVNFYSYGTDNYGYYVNIDSDLRINSDTNKAYPHGVGALVAMDWYTEADPEPLSTLAENGLLINTFIVDTNIDYGYLDAYATALLLGNGTLYKKATCKSPMTKCFVKRVGELQTINYGVFEERIIADTDDAYLFVPESNLNVGPGLLVTGDSGGSENVGVRWCNVTIPQGSIIITAHITFWGADFCTNEVTTVTIAGEDIGDSTTFSTFEDFIARGLCTATVPWVIPPDTTGEPYSTPEIKDIIQEIINRGDWVSGNSLALFVNNNGSDSYAQRNIIDYGSIPELSPLLHIEYSGQSIQELSRLTPPRVGDRIAIVDSYGATPEEWEVMSVTIRYDEGMVDLVLGDYEMNPITSMIKQTNAIQRTVT